jgi:hypothetical protein
LGPWGVECMKREREITWGYIGVGTFDRERISIPFRVGLAVLHFIVVKRCYLVCAVILPTTLGVFGLRIFPLVVVSSLFSNDFHVECLKAIDSKISATKPKFVEFIDPASAEHFRASQVPRMSEVLGLVCTHTILNMKHMVSLSHTLCKRFKLISQLSGLSGCETSLLLSSFSNENKVLYKN